MHTDPHGLLSAEFRNDPYPAYARLRQAEPVYFSEAWDTWLLTRYDDVMAGFRHPGLSADRASGYARRLPAEVRERLRPLTDNLASWLLLMDPPAHTRVRALVNRAFTPRVAEAMRPRIEELAAELVGGLAGSDEIDVIADVAGPLPVIVIVEMLGLPRGDWRQLKRWSDTLAAFMGAGAMTPEVVGAALGSVMELEEYLRAAIEERRARPADDLLSTLIKARDQDDRLSDRELLSTCTALLFGGHETTTNLIGNGLYVLLGHPEQRAMIQRAPELMPGAIDEILRYECPVQRMGRVAVEDIEIRGRRIRAGERVYMVMGAAHRDPDKFAEPDRFDVQRRGEKHLAFGLGPHYCLGAALGRMEGEIALSTLLRRFPGMEMVDQEIAWLDNLTVRGLRSLRVTRGG
jgi:cytochrome P450